MEIPYGYSELRQPSISSGGNVHPYTVQRFAILVKKWNFKFLSLKYFFCHMVARLNSLQQKNYEEEIVIKLQLPNNK